MPATCGGRISSLDLSFRIWFLFFFWALAQFSWRRLGSGKSCISLVVCITLIPRNGLLHPNMNILTPKWCLFRIGGSLLGQEWDIFIYSFNLALRQDQLKTALRHFCIKRSDCFFLPVAWKAFPSLLTLHSSSHGLWIFKSCMFSLSFSCNLLTEISSVVFFNYYYLLFLLLPNVFWTCPEYLRCVSWI